MTGTDLARALGWEHRPLGDQRPWGTGIVTAVDDSAAQLEVDIAGMRTMLPRLDGDYQVGDSVIVLRDPAASGAGQIVLATVAAVREAIIPEVPEVVTPNPATGTITVIGASSITVSTTAGTVVCSSITSTTFAVGNTVLIMWDTLGAPWVIGRVGVYTAPPPALTAPAVPGTPSLDRDGSSVAVSWSAAARATAYQVRYATTGGWSTKDVTGTSTTLSVSQGKTLTVGVRARNAAGWSDWSSSASVTYPVPPPATESVTVTIKPKWSGTWRNSRNAWDRWNVDRYGGRSTLYQGDGYGSGPLTGLAVYGTQVRDLGAISIESITVTLIGADLASGGVTITVQGSSNGTQPSGAPSSSGATASGTPGRAGTDKVALPSSVREDFRTGAVRGLATVGSAYGAVRGTSAAAGMALAVKYTRKR
jgi:hypothetical protein